MFILTRFRSLQLLLIVSFLALGCTTEQREYQETSPKFDLKTYFDGDITAWGILQNYNEKVTRRFCVEITGTWHENQGVLAEKFYFDDGEISYRNWQLIQKSDGSYVGTAEDVIGQASGQSVGFSFQWQYQLKLNVDGTDYEFYLDDWIYQIDQYRAFNQTKIKKLGIAVANLTLFFDKALPSRDCDTVDES